jgi:tryptophanyl-tRNA synthetase
MHQFKVRSFIHSFVFLFSLIRSLCPLQEKSKSQGEATSLGLFSYPVLQAADIMLYRYEA